MKIYGMNLSVKANGLHLFQVAFSPIIWHLEDSRLKLPAEWQQRLSTMLLNPLIYFWKPLALLLDVCLFREIQKIDCRLGTDELHGIEIICLLDIPIPKSASEVEIQERLEHNPNKTEVLSERKVIVEGLKPVGQ